LVNNKRANIALRRQKVWTLLTEGMPYGKVAGTIDVSRKTISLDIRFLVKDSQKYLDDMASHSPFIYKQSVEGV
jgi:transposase